MGFNKSNGKAISISTDQSRLLISSRWKGIVSLDTNLCFVLLFLLIIMMGCAPSPVPLTTPAVLITPAIQTESVMPTTSTGSITMISGYVIDECKDTTPVGLEDAPRKLVCAVETENGSIVNVSYTAYPPSPAGDKLGEKIRLDFHAGRILKGDYIRAAGNLDTATNTLVVFDEGHYIETFAKKP